jgi:hypothetical protein
MATYAIDTAKAVESLIDSGMPEPQAKAVVATFAESQEQLVTKADIRELKGQLDGRLEGLEGKLDGLKSQVTLRALAVGFSMVALLKALEYLGV